MERGRRKQVRMQMRAEQDSDMSMSPVTEGSHPAEVSSGEESDSCEQGDSTIVTAPMVKSCSGADHQEECSKCIMCAAKEVGQEFPQCGMCSVCAALSVQEMTPDKTAGVSSGLEVVTQARARAREDHWALMDGKLEEVTAGIQWIQIDIGDAAEFAANVTQPAPGSTEQQSRRRHPARKKHRGVESDTDEDDFRMHMRSARACLGESSGEDTTDYTSSSTPEADSSGDEREFQLRCALKAANTDEQREAAEIVRYHMKPASSKGLLVTGKRSRRQAKTKLQEAVEQDPDIRQALMADVESEEDEALVETESESDGSADRPGGNSDGEGDHECSCKGCDMPSETWVGDEPRCAQCTGESCGCECEGCSRKRMVRTCKCRDCEEQPAVSMAYCQRCSQLQIIDGKLLRACRCECKGCELKRQVAIAQQEYPASGEAEAGAV